MRRDCDNGPYAVRITMGLILLEQIGAGFRCPMPFSAVVGFFVVFFVFFGGRFF